jgi:outer membrane protein
MLFDGFQTTNNVKAATSQVYAQRENLRNTTQNILSNAVNAYVDVLRTRKIAKLREQNISFLQEQLRAARVRLEVGEGTRTDVAQAEARLAGAQAQASEARANVVAAESVYRELVGETPKDLAPAKPSSKAITNFDKALEIAAVQHPAIKTRQHIADALAFQVKSAEGALLPQLRAEASASVSDSNPGGALVAGQQQQRGSFGVVLDVPIYQGGRTAANIRKAKERLGQGQIDIDAVRDEVRQQLAASTSAYTASLTGVRANRELVRAARLALDGVIEERRVGQRTTLDVLNAQNDVITAQIAEVNADADSVVASYAILSATGQLDPKKLGLDVREYKPEEHFEAVKDMWFGLRTPDGR